MLSGFQILGDLDHIRKRSGMYIGDKGIDHLLTEVVDNALDEVLNRFADAVDISIDQNSLRVVVRDNGRGMIQGIYQDENSEFSGRDIVDLIYTKLFSSEKFNVHVYERSVGLHGVGLVVVNALSSEVCTEIFDGDRKTVYEFRDGMLSRKESSKLSRSERGRTGTIVSFVPDLRFFAHESIPSYNIEALLNRLRLFAYLYPYARLSVNNEPISVTSLVDIYPCFRSNLPIIEISHQLFYFACTYSLEETRSNWYGYVNMLPVHDGSHTAYLGQVLRSVWSELAGTSYLFEREDCYVGGSFLLACYVKNPTFDSQTKNRLTVPKSLIREVLGDLRTALYETLSGKKFYSKFTKPLLIRFHEYRRSLKRLRTIDYVKEAITYGEISQSGNQVNVARRSTIQGLVECTSTNREETELYIVEGQSAGGSLIDCRDPRTIAVLPLRGKPLNSTHASLDTVLKNSEFRALINSIGCGIAPLENLETIRYGKIIIAADADPDGRNIEAILLGSFLKLFPSLVSSGRLFVCEAPLYFQDGKYFWDFRDVDTSRKFQRFKGLGEMNQDQIFESMVNPHTRRLIQICLTNGNDPTRGLSLVSNSASRRLMLVSRHVV